MPFLPGRLRRFFILYLPQPPGRVLCPECPWGSGPARPFNESLGPFYRPLLKGRQAEKGSRVPQRTCRGRLPLRGRFLFAPLFCAAAARETELLRPVQYRGAFFQDTMIELFAKTACPLWQRVD